MLLHTWSLARTSWQRFIAPPPIPATGAPSPPAATTSAAAGSEIKVPKVLSPGKWSELVNNYNNITLNGKPRQGMSGTSVRCIRLFSWANCSNRGASLQAVRSIRSPRLLRRAAFFNWMMIATWLSLMTQLGYPGL